MALYDILLYTVVLCCVIFYSILHQVTCLVTQVSPVCSVSEGAAFDVNPTRSHCSRHCPGRRGEDGGGEDADDDGAEPHEGGEDGETEGARGSG